MKKLILFYSILWLIPGLLYSQAPTEVKPVKSIVQVGINVNQLLGELTKIQPPIPVRTTPYDLQLVFFPNKKISLRVGLGYSEPPTEADGGAINNLEVINFSFHSRLGMVWNYHFFDHWTLSTGPELFYSRTINQAFEEGYPVRDILTGSYGVGGVTNLKYNLSPRFSLGVEFAVHVGARYRDQRFPNTRDFNFDFNFNGEFFDINQAQILFYAPIELFAYYKF